MDRQEADLIDKLYETYSKDLYLIARHQLREKEKADDAVQTVFFIASLKIEKLKEHENKKLWLYETMSNVMKRFLYDKKYTKDGRLREILIDKIENLDYSQ